MIETAYIIVGSTIILTIVLRIVNEYDLFSQMRQVKKKIVEQRISSEKWKNFIDSFGPKSPIDVVYE